MDLLAQTVSLLLCTKAVLCSQQGDAGFYCGITVFGFMSEHLRHHEVRLLRNQRVLLVDELDPVLDHLRGAAAAWKWGKKTHRVWLICV